MTMDLLDIAGNNQGEYVVDSNEALQLKLVRTREDINDDSVTFHPDMSHQVYGNNESIYGYSGLQVQLYYSAARLTTYAGFTYKSMVPTKLSEDTVPDEVIKPLAEKLQESFCTSIDVFTEKLEKDSVFQPPGEMVFSFSTSENGSAGEERTFEVYACHTETPGLRDYHERLQTFLLWYIDAASFIDVDDDKWRFFICFERYRSSQGSSMYAVAGYTTVYEYYAYPCNIRPRISQMLVLPPFQKMGVGSEMLQCIYSTYASRKDVVDITVEDPSDDFIRLRDFLDCKKCSKLKEFSHSNLALGFSKEMSDVAKREFKINSIQSRRVYEILRLGVTDVNNKSEYEKYRLDLKRRLFVPYQKEDAQLKKLRNILRPEELALSVTNKEQRLNNLDRLYQDLEEKYLHTLTRLSVD